MLEGYIHPDFAEVGRVLSAQLGRLRRKGRPGGAAVCVWHRGEPVVDCWGGTQNEAGDAWRQDTLSFSFSTTKGVTSTLFHTLAERGQLDYGTPVREFWPEFSQNGKGEITVRDVLCHEAGLYHVSEMIDDAHHMLDWNTMVRALERARPRHAPGASHGYHAFTYGWLVGEIIQRMTGKPFREVLEAELAQPLELDGLFVGMPADQMHRRAQLINAFPGDSRARDRVQNGARRVTRVLRGVGLGYDVSDALSALMPNGIEQLDFNSEAACTASVPAANGTFTARSLAKLFAVLAGGGTLGDVRLLSPERLEEVRREQNRAVGRVVPYPMRWRLGYHRVNTIRSKVRRGLGHSGFGGSGVFADPDRELAAALVLNSGTGTPFGDARIIRITDASIRCADSR
ncbi:MAG: beta-lactamase family protein [Deltaproteobacteria bacterium]|nr:beta-lactamase family protein [Deltaproteobacteria bacterium]